MKFTRLREPFNALSHYAGALLSLIGIFGLLTVQTANYLSTIIYGFSLFMLYLFSGIYHSVKTKVSTFRLIDHSMIFLLIAGTYTPIYLVSLKGLNGYILLSLIWTVAIAGITTKLVFRNIPRFVYTGIYVAMGWLALFFISAIYRSISTPAFILLVSGGLLYTVGAVIYALKKFPGIKYFHEVFHVFILMGSLAHYFMTLNIIKGP